MNNLYEWSITISEPDGGAFTDFLAKLNDPTFDEVSFGDIYSDPPVTGCFAGHCDWRLPIIDELGTILIGPDAAPGQASSCSAAPCIDPDFAAVGGPTVGAASPYRSASEIPNDPIVHWIAAFHAGTVNAGSKHSGAYVRAVRTGSCD